MRQWLLSSQLSVVVRSHELKTMLIKASDKNYFGEGIKKVFEDKMKQYEFIDIDRPYHSLRQVEAVRLNFKKWDKFKREYELMAIDHAFEERQRHKNN